MLNEWSDRAPPPPGKRQQLRRQQVWFGCLTALGGLSLAAGLLARLLG